MHLPVVGRVDPKSLAIGTAIGAGLGALYAPVTKFVVDLWAKFKPAPKGKE